MNKFNRVLALVLALAMILSFAACGGQGSTEASGETAEPGAMTDYTVTLTTAGGMVMPEIDVYVYADDTLADMKQYGQTDENGKVSFQLPQSDSYAIAVSGTPKGYEVAPSYSFDGTSANIKLTSSLVKDESLSGATLGLGDVMYDFSVVTPAGETVTLSEMLEEKKVVLLNFWYTTCTWCLKEFSSACDNLRMFLAVKECAAKQDNE